MADCNTCSQYMSVEDILRRSIKCDANGNVAMQGGLLNGLPSYSTALFWLQGTVEIEGTSYFVDKKTAKLFPITNPDFTLGVNSGFPYKSAATFSAPVSDAVLIAADVNNYLYAGDGTPNQIPVVSLFQDIDYEHRLFCKHSAQVVDSNGVETSEPRVTDIALYSTALATTDLVNAQTYFGVPVESEVAKWITPTGNDTTGDGSKANPWKTIIAVEGKSLAANTQIYVKTLTEVFPDRWNLTSLKKWKALGLVKVSSTHASYSVTPQAAIEIEGFVINATGKVNGFYITVGSLTAVIKRCYIIAGTNAFNMQGVSSLIQNNVIAGSANGFLCAATTGALNIFGNHLATTSLDFASFSASVDLTLNYKYNKGSNHIELKGSYTAVNILNNRLSSLLPTSGAYTGTVNIKYNTIVPKATGNVISSSVVAAERYVYNIENNTFNVPNTINVRCINLVDQPTPTIKNNRMLVDGISNTSGGVKVDAPTTDCHPATIQNNYFRNASPNSSYALYLGNENVGGGDDNLRESVITGNSFIYSKVFSDADNVIHGLFITRNAGCIVKYNYIAGSSIGIVFKSTTQDNANAVCDYNVLVNCHTPLLAKGFKNTKFYNNTIINNAEKWDDISCQVIDNVGASTGCKFKNNIFYDTTAVASDVYLKKYIYVTEASKTDFESDYNSFYSPNNNRFQYGASIVTFAEWVAFGLDTNSIYGNPNLSNYIPSVPIIGLEIESHNIGLDILTDWTVPTIVTKQQGAEWQMGAYVI